MDSLGIGSAADAAHYGGEGFTDEGANTLGHIAEAFAQGAGDNGRPLHLLHFCALCESVRAVLDESELMIGRVIARPFLGSSARDFRRTGNRHDYSVPPPSRTVLQLLCEDGGTVIGITPASTFPSSCGERRWSREALWAAGKPLRTSVRLSQTTSPCRS